ncbi:MAG: DUF4385 domain-containing protein [Alphaproteobacteria bacterium]|nr:DUF4385 domain-containing protein [Alphaproteobacteria bacterium]
MYAGSAKQQKAASWAKRRDTYAWNSKVNYRLHPEQYKVGKGEQGVLLCEPYKSEILPYWRFKTPKIAQESSEKIFEMFNDYLSRDEFIGADMARKYLQMGYTRARRYANHQGGLKYDKQTGQELPYAIEDQVKAQSARIFYAKWREAEANPHYQKLKKEWKIKFG